MLGKGLPQVGAVACVVLALGGCATLPGGPAADGTDEARTVARSIWGVVPSAPGRNADLRPELIRGSAVAVSADTLLANCVAVGRRSRIGLVRHNKYRLARVVDTDADGQVCALQVAEGPLNPAPGRRSFEDLRVGEPVFAFTNRSSADLDLARGHLAAKSEVGDPFLETTLVLPPRSQSAVLFDGAGNLIGLGSAGPAAESLVIATPMAGDLAPELAVRDGGVAPFLLAGLYLLRRSDGERTPPTLFRLGPDRDSDGPRGATTRVATAATTETTNDIVDRPTAAPTRAAVEREVRAKASRAVAGIRQDVVTATRPERDRPTPGRAAVDGDRDRRAGRDARGHERGREARNEGRGREGRGRSGRDEGSRGRGHDRDDDRGRSDDRGRGGGRDGGDRGRDDDDGRDD
jgi:hypothetical protein